MLRYFYHDKKYYYWRVEVSQDVSWTRKRRVLIEGSEILANFLRSCMKKSLIAKCFKFTLALCFVKLTNKPTTSTEKIKIENQHSFCIWWTSDYQRFWRFVRITIRISTSYILVEILMTQRHPDKLAYVSELKRNVRQSWVVCITYQHAVFIQIPTK